MPVTNAVIILGLTVPALLLGGYVGAKLWQWFLMPLSPRLPTLTIWHALALRMTVKFFAAYLPNKDSSDDPEQQKVALFVGKHLVFPAGALLVGWLIQRFAL